MQERVGDSLTTGMRKFSVLNIVKDDKNFQAFIMKYAELKQKCIEEDSQVMHYSQEDDYGNVEYKLKLANPSLERVEHLTTQMKFRLEVSSIKLIFISIGGQRLCFLSDWSRR